MDVPLKDCLTLQVSEENANSPDFDLANYMNKKIKETLFKKALGGEGSSQAGGQGRQGCHQRTQRIY
jgi:hypothetical protein